MEQTKNDEFDIVFEEFINSMLCVAKKELNEKGEISPLFLLGNYTPNKEQPFEANLISIPNFMMHPEMKDLLSKSIKKMAEKFKSDFYLFLSEVWMKSDKNNDYEKMRNQYKEVRLMPGRKEAILIIAETVKKQYSKTIIFEKINNEYVYESLDEKEGDEPKMSGKFANILYKKKEEKWDKFVNYN